MNNFETLREELENDNYHTDALIVEALELMMYDVIAELATIAKQHEEAGYLTAELDLRRNELAKVIKLEIEKGN